MNTNELASNKSESNESASNEPASVVMQAYWAMIVRRKWLVMSSILAGVMVAGALCLVLPKSYRSSTLILIEDQKIPDEYVKGIGGGSIEERVTMIQQQVMSRTLLSQTMEELAPTLELHIALRTVDTIPYDPRLAVDLLLSGAIDQEHLPVEFLDRAIRAQNHTVLPPGYRPFPRSLEQLKELTGHIQVGPACY